MILTRKQEEGLKIALERYRNKERYTCIAGYAGTGKSTLVSFIISALGFLPTEVAYVSFTGKAALVLTNKGCPNAMTAHKLLYQSVLTPTGYIHKPKEKIEDGFRLVVVDEVSMLPQEMWDLLLSHKVHVIALGDPGQLSPINGTNNVLEKPHIFLDEIMRQALDNEIIRLTLDIREGKELQPFKGKDVMILSKAELSSGMCGWADQILCATNATRRNLNNEMRKMKGFESENPQDGDKIICLKNYWDSYGKNDVPLVNGSIGTLQNSYSDYIVIPKKIVDIQKPNNRIDLIRGDFITEEGDIYQNLEIDKEMIKTGNKCVNGQIAYRLLKNKITKDLIPMEFDYGYAITVHKAQGSQWEKVLVIEENFPTIKDEHCKWLYTACTRPSEKLILIKK